MKFTADITGLDDFEDLLIALAEFPGVDAELLRMGEEIRSEAIANLNDGTPPESRSGALENSVRVEQDIATHTVTVGTSLDYGAQLEFGTVNAPERPWFGPAVATVVKDIGPRFRRALAALADSVSHRAGLN